MIENKIIIIDKVNSFDESWRIFKKDDSQVEFLTNPNFVYQSTEGIVKQITFAKKIVLVVASAFYLPRKIEEELTWVNKYIDIEVIAKDKSLLASIKKWRIKSTVNPTIRVNALSIYTKSENNYIFADSIVETKTKISDIILNVEGNYSLIEKGDKVWILDKEGYGQFSSLVSYCKNRDIDYTYVIDTPQFSKKTHEVLVKESVAFAIANIAENVILIKKKDQALVAKYGTVVISLEKTSHLIKDIYVSDNKIRKLTGKEIPESLFVFNGKKVVLENYSDKTVHTIVNTHTIEDFFNECFDKSKTEEYRKNIYSRTVRYEFELVPPLYDNSYAISTIYKSLEDIYKKLSIKQPEFVYGKDDLVQIGKMVKDIGLYFEWYHFDGFYGMVRNYIKQAQSIIEGIYALCLDVYMSFTTSTDNGRYSKFDDEIKAYQKIIQEKQEQIESGIDVMNAKRRIDILSKKIAGLKIMKDKFVAKEDGRNTDAADSFKILFDKILGQQESDETLESVDKVLSSTTQDEKVLFQEYLKCHLKDYYTYLNGFLSNLQSFLRTDVPEHDIVYQKDGQDYICVESFDDYQSKNDLCKKYNLKCIARR